jgi:hypothetical protein
MNTLIQNLTFDLDARILNVLNMFVQIKDKVSLSHYNMVYLPYEQWLKCTTGETNCPHDAKCATITILELLDLCQHVIDCFDDLENHVTGCFDDMKNHITDCFHDLEHDDHLETSGSRKDLDEFVHSVNVEDYLFQEASVTFCNYVRF